jgi:uncharacterized protein (DUF952 family)
LRAIIGRMIIHISTEEAWLAAVAAGIYEAESLASEGFIHCSTPQQLLGTANDIFHGQAGLVLLCLAPEKVAAPIVYEDCYETGQLFPHVYGPINLTAVAAIIDFPTQENGSLALPEELDRT